MLPAKECAEWDQGHPAFQRLVHGPNLWSVIARDNVLVGNREGEEVPAHIPRRVRAWSPVSSLSRDSAQNSPSSISLEMARRTPQSWAISVGWRSPRWAMENARRGVLSA